MSVSSGLPIAASQVRLRRDLYLFSEDNRVLLVSQCKGTTPEALAAPYRQVIQRELNPEQGMPCASVRVARGHFHAGAPAELGQHALDAARLQRLISASAPRSSACCMFDRAG